tara:strand:+ start:58 stop:558 length:501 start_codon:yes stop_codon:yes gene_type:complete
MFSFYNRHNNNLYNKLVELSRNIYFYKKLSLQDNFETRVILIFLHFSIILININERKTTKFPQKIFDNIFLNIEYHLREVGHGDVSVNKKMKILNKIFYDILLKIKSKKEEKFLINKIVVKNHLSMNVNVKSEYIDKISLYLESFHDFCFELDNNSMIEGKINFKY